MRVLILLSILIVFLAGCKNQKNDKGSILINPYRFELTKLIDNKKETNLTDVAIDLQYILLETRPDIFVSEIVNFSITESYIFVLDNKSNLFQFDRYGKFIRLIGNIGKGPNEYLFINDFVASEKMNTIVVFDQNRLIKYDMLGNITGFSKHIGAKCVDYYPDRFAFYKQNYTQDPVNLIVTDKNLVPIKEYINHSPKPKSKRWPGNSPLYVFNNNLYLKEHCNDTLSLVQESKKVPYAIFEEKDMALDYSINVDPFNIPKEFDNKLTAEYIYESNKYMFVSYIQGARIPGSKIGYIRLLLFKESNNALCLEGGTFANDVDGGLKFWPNTIFNNNTLISCINAIDIKAHVASEAFKNSNPKYPEKKRELEKLANSLSENDNPVLMLVKLKE